MNISHCDGEKNVFIHQKKAQAGASAAARIDYFIDLIIEFARNILRDNKKVDHNNKGKSFNNHNSSYSSICYNNKNNDMMNNSENNHHTVLRPYHSSINNSENNQNNNNTNNQDNRLATKSLKVIRTNSSGMFVSVCEDDDDDDDLSCSTHHNRYGLDIITGHLVLSYMEAHLKDSTKLDNDWLSLSSYEPDDVTTSDALLPENIRKNRTLNILPYNWNRFILNKQANVNRCDYINASKITDHDPNMLSYIFTQNPLPHTVADFWQLVWESRSTAIINLTSLTDQSQCHPYWPEAGVEIYHKFEVHLVSQHINNRNYVVRNLLLRNLQQQQQQQRYETRTITQYHYLKWPKDELPLSIKSLLEFRRKVNKFCRGSNNALVIHCCDGAGRTGTYALIDNVINRISNGAKELDIAAALEHFRDQRMKCVASKEQYELVLFCVAECVRNHLLRHK
ncbi:hypothetical protein HELRODRAFT_183084 [Helobdella robusta]|uniref:Uncharacterized protein n=1 Tax=Helobdella robusta TaxID=6412 RepID=T1FJ50_HELRO|nr:hypothetical protein HELRODRAFT_183084 [Helobdella robusta]ESN89876.1 hypothetical protein HELRODRAFT_183084 [Helobdella robusta]